MFVGGRRFLVSQSSFGGCARLSGLKPVWGCAVWWTTSVWMLKHLVGGGWRPVCCWAAAVELQSWISKF